MLAMGSVEMIRVAGDGAGEVGGGDVEGYGRGFRVARRYIWVTIVCQCGLSGWPARCFFAGVKKENTMQFDELAK